MCAYSYKLHRDNSNQEKKKKYKEKDLKLMTTYQLKDICSKEKLVKSIVNPLDKQELIRLIMKYRGESDTLLIDCFSEGGLERLENFLKKCSKEVLERIDIDYPGRITLYEGLSLEILDDYIIKSNDSLEAGNVLLVDGNFNVCTVFNIKKLVINNEEKFYLVKDAKIPVKESENKHYQLLLFSHKYSELLYDIYKGEEMLNGVPIECYSLAVLQFEVKKLKETTTPLAIDFGTSNTTAGIYINKENFQGLNNNNFSEDPNSADSEEQNVKIVKIIDFSKEEPKITPLIPSIVGVKNIKEDGIEYIFGYDAQIESKKRYTDDGLTVFYDIKRWISDFDKKEKAIDENEKTTLIRRKDMIKAYLEYIISLANQRFKCSFKNICISCPSKQKYKFHTLFKEILSDYIVESNNILEESAAVLYNTISELIVKKNYINGEQYKALIIDCGGGTTDLTGCTFSITNNRVSYELNIETSYENGDTDFGGNNLTFRIMQFIKIILASKIVNNDMNIKEIILDEFKIDIFRFIDKYSIKELFESIDEEYEKADAIIPTKYKLYETKSKEEYCKVKSNYYFLFDLAEEIKKLFFSNPELLRVTLTTKDNINLDEPMIQYDKWKLSAMKNGKLQVINDVPDISLNIYEVATLIKGDIYNIVNKFLDNLYKNDELYDYSLIKLTGQSCRVDIFKDAIKEFVPGKVIQLNKATKQNKDEYDLKLTCLKGTLKYLYARNFGYADITITSKTPTFPYRITAYTHTGEQKVLINGKQIPQGFISRFMDRILLKLYLMDNDDTVKYEYDYNFDNEDLREIDAETIGEEYPNINQHETDNIENNEIKFFVWTKEEFWGFYVLAILRRDEQLYIGKEKFFYFENDQWERNFFDGLK
jgi:hypothetical protein